MNIITACMLTMSTHLRHLYAIYQARYYLHCCLWPLPESLTTQIPVYYIYTRVAVHSQALQKTRSITTLRLSMSSTSATLSALFSPQDAVLSCPKTTMFSLLSAIGVSVTKLQSNIPITPSTSRALSESVTSIFVKNPKTIELSQLCGDFLMHRRKDYLYRNNPTRADFAGTVRIDGTNTSMKFTNGSQISRSQSRNLIITTECDNYGATRFFTAHVADVGRVLAPFITTSSQLMVTGEISLLRTLHVKDQQSYNLTSLILSWPS